MAKEHAKNRNSKKSLKSKAKKTLKKSTKKTTIQKKNNSRKEHKQLYVVLFYAEWCPHCQHMKPEWEKMKHNYENNDSVKFIDVESADANKNDIIEEINKRISPNSVNIDGYPTILSMNGNEIDYYKGERTADLMGGWINSMKGGYRKDLQGKPATKSVRKGSAN